MNEYNTPQIINNKIIKLMPVNRKLHTARLILQRLTIRHAKEYLNLYNKNLAYLAEWMPFVFYKLSFSEIINIIKYQHKIIQQNQGLDFGIFLKTSQNDNILKATNKSKLIGKITIQNLILGPLCSAGIGYWIDSSYYSNGYTTEAVARIIIFIFEELKLHRIWASVQPNNKPSIRVLEKLCFSYEGTHRKEIYINNEWKDHLHYSLLDSDYFSNKTLYKKFVNFNN